MTIKLYSWNVNGIRAIFKKGFFEFIERYQPDVLCLQEVKATSEQVAFELPGYQTYWCAAEKKGYSGTAILTRLPIQRFFCGIGVPEHDKEGRVITVEFPSAYVVNVYTPNSQDGLRRLDYRTREWDVAFRNFVKNLEKEKPVIFCGDLNVAHKEIDLAHPKANVKTAGFTPEERASFEELLASGFVDTFRVFQQGPGQYSWWSYRTRARERNMGWRIDYFCVSESLRSGLVNASILADVMGSDHCPVGLEVTRETIFGTTLHT